MPIRIRSHQALALTLGRYHLFGSGLSVCIFRSHFIYRWLYFCWETLIICWYEPFIKPASRPISIRHTAQQTWQSCPNILVYCYAHIHTIAWKKTHSGFSHWVKMPLYCNMADEKRARNWHSLMITIQFTVKNILPNFQEITQVFIYSSFFTPSAFLSVSWVTSSWHQARSLIKGFPLVHLLITATFYHRATQLQ